MSEWAKILDLGHDTTVSRSLLKTPTRSGWTARITGTSEQYELARTFLDRVTPGDREWNELARGGQWFKIPGSGLFEYRQIGDGTLAGFFIAGWRGLREVSHDDAFARAKRMG